MEQPHYQRIITESELDRQCQQFVEQEFPKAVKSVNRFSGKGNLEPKVKCTGVDRHV